MHFMVLSIKATVLLYTHLKAGIIRTPLADINDGLEWWIGPVVMVLVASTKLLFVEPS